MKYEHQINWANAYDNNLDDCTGRSVRNACIVLLSTLTLLVLERMKNVTAVLCMTTIKVQPLKQFVQN